MLADAMFLGREGSLNRGSDLALLGGRASAGGGASSLLSATESDKYNRGDFQSLYYNFIPKCQMNLHRSVAVS